MQIELNIGHLPEALREHIEEAVDDLFTECAIEGIEPDPDEVFELITTLQTEYKYED